MSEPITLDDERKATYQKPRLSGAVASSVYQYNYLPDYKTRKEKPHTSTSS